MAPKGKKVSITISAKGARFHVASVQACDKLVQKLISANISENLHFSIKGGVQKGLVVNLPDTFDEVSNVYQYQAYVYEIEQNNGFLETCFACRKGLQVQHHWNSQPVCIEPEAPESPQPSDSSTSVSQPPSSPDSVYPASSERTKIIQLFGNSLGHSIKMIRKFCKGIAKKDKEWRGIDDLIGNLLDHVAQKYSNAIRSALAKKFAEKNEEIRTLQSQLADLHTRQIIDSCAQEIYLLHLRAPAPACLTEVQEAEGYGPQCRPARVVMEHALSCKLSTVQTFVQDIELSNAKIVNEASSAYKFLSKKLHSMGAKKVVYLWKDDINGFVMIPTTLLEKVAERNNVEIKWVNK